MNVNNDEIRLKLMFGEEMFDEESKISQKTRFSNDKNKIDKN